MSSNPFAKRGQLLCRWPAEPQKWSELQCRCIEFDPDHASTRLLGQIYVYSHATCICCQVTGLQLNVTQHPIRAPGHIPQSQSRRAVSRCRGRARFPQRINVRGEEPHLILINRHSRDLTAFCLFPRAKGDRSRQLAAARDMQRTGATSIPGYTGREPNIVARAVRDPRRHSD
jgi:hypothetical protein